MKSTFSRSLLVVLLLATAASLASGATIACTGVSNVATQLGTTPGSDDCSVAGAPGTLFSNFEVYWDGLPNTATVSIVSGSLVGGTVFLSFQVQVPAATGDLLLRYQATNLTGIDFFAQPTPLGAGGNLVVAEIACDAAFVSDVCSGNTLANVGDTSTGQVIMGSQAFSLAPTVHIQKDLTYNNVSLSQFTNSHDLSQIPEPMTFSMVGLGLLGFGLLGRRQWSRR